jgi:catechol 2,3-dioxygenase-like lactoylglutathione lyase family enzyme
MRPSGGAELRGPARPASAFWDPGGLRYPAGMLDHVTLHVQDLQRALSFYRAALAPIGYSVAMEFPSAAGLGEAGKLDLWMAVTDKPLRPMHLAFRSNRAQVDAFHAAALAAGGTDNGAPGLRTDYHPHYYAAFVIDPEGNNIEVVCHEPPAVKKPPPARATAARWPAKKVRKPPRKPARKAAKTNRTGTKKRR